MSPLPTPLKRYKFNLSQTHTEFLKLRHPWVMIRYLVLNGGQTWLKTLWHRRWGCKCQLQLKTRYIQIQIHLKGWIFLWMQIWRILFVGSRSGMNQNTEDPVPDSAIGLKTDMLSIQMGLMKWQYDSSLLMEIWSYLLDS